MEKQIELQRFNHEPLRPRGRGSISEGKGQRFDNDRYELAKVGKKQVLKVCSVLTIVMTGLIMVASLRTGVYDWTLMRIDVYLGDLACVSLRDCHENSC